MKQIIEKLSNGLTLFKENISVIIIVPTLLGGLWQLFELSKMSLAFIRFFSVSQLVSDGLLILVILGSIALSVRFGLTLITVRDENVSERPDPTVRRSILLIGISAVFSWTVLFSQWKKIFLLQNVSLLEFLVMIPLSILTISCFFSGVKDLFSIWINSGTPQNSTTELSEKKMKKIVNIIHFILSLVLIVIFCVVIHWFTVTLSNFREKYVAPKNLTNLRNLEAKYNLNSKSDSTSRVIYFNDKFIFLERHDSTGASNIHILKFDDLVNETLIDKTGNEVK